MSTRLETLIASAIHNGKFQVVETTGPNLTDANNNELIKGTTTSSAVNELNVTNAAASGTPVLSTSGGDTNVGMQIGAKGTGTVNVTVPFLSKKTATTITTAGAGTYAAAEILGGIILRDPAGASRTDTTHTAAQLVAACPGAVVGSTFELVVRNTADAAETITVQGGTGVTISGTATIAQNNSKLFYGVFTNVTGSSEAVTLYSVGTFVH